jgi:uncharacterized repeat protein (TIGR03803 family)
MQAKGALLPSDVAPVLSTVSPNSAVVGSSMTSLSLVGSNFVPDSFVSFNGVPLSTTFVDASDLTATLPGTLLTLDGLYPVTVTNPDTSGAISSAANFTVTGAVVSVSPSSAQVPATGLQQFSATVLGPANNAVTWSINGVSGGNSTLGTISAGGLYTAPKAVPNPATVTVTATSQAFPGASGSATVTIGPYTEKPVYSFTSLTDGAAPRPLILASNGYFYGAAQLGGTGCSTLLWPDGCGTVFKVDSSGNVTSLHDFTGDDGANPIGALSQASDGNFYGLTQWGGAYNEGAIFKVHPTGSLTTLYSFTGGSDGAQPSGALVIGTDGYFYGVAFAGGDYGAGVVFKADSSGGEATFYSFSGGTDGYGPQALIQASDGNFYGTTQNGGNSSCNAFGGSGCGTVFKIDTAGHLTTLYSFSGGSDGAQPEEALVEVSDGHFYGTTLFGGDPNCTASGYTGCGTIFKIDSVGDFSLVHQFSGEAEGGVPFSSLIQAGDGDFYGTATAGGDPSCSVYASGENYPTYIGCGTVFKMDSAGDVNALYSFTGSPNDGSNPFGTLIEGSDGYLYGTTRWGGTDSSCPYTSNGGCGTVFKVSGPGGRLPVPQTHESKRIAIPTLNPKPLTTQPKAVPVKQPRKGTPRVPNLRGVKHPPIME